MSAKVKCFWRGREYIMPPNYTNLFNMYHNHYEDYEGKEWIELDWDEQKHWEKLGRDLGHAFDAARRDAVGGCLLVPVLFEMPDPDVPFKTLPRTGPIPTKKRPKDKKPYERESVKASGASRRKSRRRKQAEQSAPVEPPVVSMPPVQQDDGFPAQYQGALPFGFSEPIQYPMPMPFGAPVPQHAIMGSPTSYPGAFAPEFDPYFGLPPFITPMEYYPDNDMMRLIPEGPLPPSYIPREWTVPENLLP
ncbi:hypothetical protein BDZ89DRAFT_1189258 [Hymenopellis radicata]|nr:hypothetical protein BDZ89DRAFT_1189258 [Hymenopellis radicata]